MGTSITLLRLLLAVVIGGVVGYERASNHSKAGIRTYILISVSMAMIALIQLAMMETAYASAAANPDFQGAVKLDYGRLSASAITGISFLGAGTILHLKNDIIGLTTAASMWAIAVTGLAAGMGYYVLAVSGCFIVVLTLNTVNKIKKRYSIKMSETQLDIFFQADENVTGDVLKTLSKHNIDIEKIEFIEPQVDKMNHIKYFIKLPGDLKIEQLKEELCYANKNITKIKKNNV